MSCSKSYSKEGEKLGFEPLQWDSALKLFLVSRVALWISEQKQEKITWRQFYLLGHLVIIDHEYLLSNYCAEVLRAPGHGNRKFKKPQPLP